MLAVALSLLLAPAPVLAQGPATLQFTFSNPGARAMGFGGAFAALADDATAAFANPAGLVQLIKVEASLEGRHWSYATPFNRSGRAAGSPTGLGIDIFPGLNEATSDARIGGLSFASVVVPFGRSSFAVYRHQLARFRSLFETQGLFSTVPGGGPGVVRSFDSRTAVEVDVVGLGLAYAYRVTDAFSVGAGVARFKSAIGSNVEGFLPDDDSSESLFSENHFLRERMLFGSKVAADGSSWGLSAGFLVSLGAKASIGGFYRQGPEMDFGIQLRSGPAWDPGIPPGTLLAGAAARLTLPDTYGLGLAVRPGDSRLTLAFEWDHVEYADIVTSLSRGPDFGIDQTLADGDELHFGAEYAILAARPIVALRLGAWLDPDHRFRSTSSDPFERAFFPEGEDHMHYALGVGVALEHVQVDVGVDVSKLVDTVSISLIYSF